jgi:hypothetical protein
VIARVLFRIATLLLRTATAVLPEHHPSRIYADSLARSNRLRPMVNNTIPRNGTVGVAPALIMSATGIAVSFQALPFLPSIF